MPEHHVELHILMVQLSAAVFCLDILARLPPPDCPTTIAFPGVTIPSLSMKSMTHWSSVAILKSLKMK